MLAKIVRIGNSRGIRIPKSVFEQCHFGSEVTLKIDKKRLIIETAKRKPREGWEEAFKGAKKTSKKNEKVDYIPTKFDEEEWEW
jgi:antitoxin MazE